ncbi:MAG: cadherin domain-containing protein, partial [Pseudomonadota bacterium]
MSDQHDAQSEATPGPKTIDSALDREVRQGEDRRREDVEEFKVDVDNAEQAGQAPRAGGYGSPDFATDTRAETSGDPRSEADSIEQARVGARTVEVDSADAATETGQARRGDLEQADTPARDGETGASSSPPSSPAQSPETSAGEGVRTQQGDVQAPTPVSTQDGEEGPALTFVPIDPSAAGGDTPEASGPAPGADGEQPQAEEGGADSAPAPGAGGGMVMADGDGAQDQVSEDAANGDRVGVVASAVSSDGSMVTYSLADDAQGRFAIDPATGAVFVRAPELLDFEADQSHEIVVNVVSANGSISTQSFVIRVTDDDEFDISPIVDGDARDERVSENASAGEQVGVAVSAMDADGTENAVTYRLSDNPNDAFAIDPASGIVTVAYPNGLDFEAAQTMQIEVTATSADGSNSSQRFAIAIDNHNEFSISPTGDADASADAVAESARVGDLVGVTALADDSDGVDGVTYSLSDNPDGAFAIDAQSGVVSVAEPSALDFESSQAMRIEVTATSDDGSTSTQAFTIAINDEDEFDVSVAVDGDSAQDTIAESAAVGDPVGITAFAEDEDGTGSAVQYSLSENPNDAFTVDALTGEVTVARPAGLDFESAQSMRIEVTATSEDGSISTQFFDIAVTDTNEFEVSPVADRDGARDSIAEAAEVGDTVGVTAFADDQDGSDSNVQYSLSTNPNDAFAIDPQSGVVTVADPDGLDFESAESVRIEVTATSEDGSTSAQSFDITITDDDEFDVTATVDSDVGADTVVENASAGDEVGITAFASDDDGSNNGVEYSLSTNPNDAFAIDAESGVVTVADPSGLDFESAQTMQIEVTATSDDGSTSTQTFDIAITDDDEFDVSAVSDSDGGANTVAENASAGDTVGVTAFASDDDGANNGVEYSLSANPNDAFAIDADSGVVTVADPGGLDFESAQTMQIEVTATSDDGSTSSQTFDIAISDNDEFDISAVSDTDGSANTINEGASAGDTVGVTAFASDDDGSNNGVEYSLSDNPNDAFAIDAESGEVTVADPSGLDFESTQTMQIEVTATSDDGSISTQTFDIAVTDDSEFDVSAISDSDSSANTITENASAGDTVGVTAFASDADGTTNGVEYSLSTNPNNAFAIDPDSGVVTVADPDGLDFESAQTMQIEVTATSDDGSTSTQTFDIAISDNDEFDISAVSDTDGGANTVNEGASAGDTVGVTAFASDDDGSNNGVEYSLSANPDDAFAIDADSGVVTVADPDALDFESAQTMQIEVTATSNDGSTSTQTFDIAITDDDEFDVSAVSDSDASANTIAENASAGDTVGVTAFASDEDGSTNDV